MPQASERRVCRLLGVTRPTRALTPNDSRGGRGAAGPGETLDRDASDVRVSARMSLAAVSRRAGHQSEADLPAAAHAALVRASTPRHPAAARRGRSSIAVASNERWAMDVTHSLVGADGWAHVAAVIDCHDRAVLGYEFTLRACAQEAERAFDETCLARFGTLQAHGSTPTVHSDNGSILESRRSRRPCKDYLPRQEWITPYSPEPNGVIERSFPSLKDEYGWQHTFASYREERRTIAHWIGRYNAERSHQSLGYLSPEQFSVRQ